MTTERDPSTPECRLDQPTNDNTELRVLAHLAWLGWPNNAENRRVIAKHEARYPHSAHAWARVIEAVCNGVQP